MSECTMYKECALLELGDAHTAERKKKGREERAGPGHGAGLGSAAAGARKPN